LIIFVIEAEIFINEINLLNNINTLINTLPDVEKTKVTEKV